MFGRQCQNPLFTGSPGPQQGTEGKGNTTMTNTQPTPSQLQDRFGRQVAARLAGGAAELPYHVTERLRAARAQAVAQRKRVASLGMASSVSASGGSASLAFGDKGQSLWHRIASALPLI